MALTHLSFNNVEFGYPGMSMPLFSGLTIQFPEEWTGIIGPNGAGKTTLLRVACGAFEPLSGIVQRQGKTFYVAQRTDDIPAYFEDFLWSPDAAMIKSRLCIGDDWFERWNTLSHGERKRSQIAIALWFEPDILALDEPTNHIDTDARRLLVQILKEFHGTGLLVSHDRELLDELCTHCLMLEPPVARLRPGGITDALAQEEIDFRTAQYESDTLRRTALRLREEAQRRRMAAEQKAADMRGSKQKKSSIHDHDARAKRILAKMTSKDTYAGKLVGQMTQRASSIEAQRAEIPVQKRYETGIWIDRASYIPRDFLLRLPAGKLLLNKGNDDDDSVENESRVLCYPDLVIGGKDRIALTGANGLGKSTLIRYILSHLQIPEENLINIPQEITAEESRLLLGRIKELPNEDQGRIMTTISRLGSRPARLLESEQPSPGEIRKLLLALGIIRGPHFIIMDEPTNHMDLPSILCLEEALADCPCAMLLVSHDKSFLQKTTVLHWELQPEKAIDGTIKNSRLVIMSNR